MARTPEDDTDDGDEISEIEFQIAPNGNRSTGFRDNARMFVPMPEDGGVCERRRLLSQNRSWAAGVSP